MTPTVLIRQGGLRFHWDRGHHVYVETPEGSLLTFFFVGHPTNEPVTAATLEEVHDAIDRYCEERKR